MMDIYFDYYVLITDLFLKLVRRRWFLNLLNLCREYVVEGGHNEMVMVG